MRAWERRIVCLGLLLVVFSGASAAAEASIYLSGRIAGGVASWQEVALGRARCEMLPGASAVLELKAEVVPPSEAVALEASELPPWVTFSPASGVGLVAALAQIEPPASAVGLAVVLRFFATSSSGAQASLEIELIVGEPKGDGDDPDYEVPGGEETTQGVTFEIPFVPDASSFALGRVTDCATGKAIDPARLSTEFFLAPAAVPPYAWTDLDKVVVRSPGYLPLAITEFKPVTISLLFFRMTFVTPARPNVCLTPAGEPSLRAVEPLGACVGNVTTFVTSPDALFAWQATGLFTSYEVFVYDNPCGQYPPETPTPAPAPVPAPAPSPTPVATTAGVWEPLWDRLSQEQRDELAKRNLSGWGWVKAARELLGDAAEAGGEPVPAEATVEEAEGILLPDTGLIARLGPFAFETMSTTLPLEALLEPGQAFIWQVFGVYEDATGEQGAMLSAPQCVRYQPTADTGEVTPVVSCPTCDSTGSEWDCDQPIQIVRPLSYYPQKGTMSPDERIAVSILGSDQDALYWKCVCLEKTQKKINSYPERVGYDWQLTGIGRLVDAFENSAIYELPVGLEPGQTVTATIRVTLHAPRGGDKSIDGRVVLTITAGAEGCDDYSVQAQVIQPQLETCPPPLPEFGRDCIAVLKYGKADGPIAASILVYPMAYTDEAMLLKALHTDTDELAIRCENTVCDLRPEIDYPLEDPLELTWDDQGAGGTFPLGNVGRSVVYVPPQKDDVTVRCVPKDLIVRDPNADKTENQPVARVGVDLTLCDESWLPEKDNAATFTARTYQIRYSTCTYPGPARRITFDLSDVSNETGYCTNRGDSEEMDLFFSKTRLDGVFHLCAPFDEGPADGYARATSHARSTEVAVTVSSADYGGYGKIAVSAWNARPIEPREPDEETHCILGPTTTEIPRDDVPQDGNHIADRWDGLYGTGDKAETADEDVSLNNAQRGDGLTRYEEYRGVDANNDGAIAYDPARTTAQELAAPQNERLSPYQKDLFVTTLDGRHLEKLVYGKAFETSWIMVHKFEGDDVREIDVMWIEPAGGRPLNRAYTTPDQTDTDGHLNKLDTPGTPRSWAPDWLGGAAGGTVDVYAIAWVFDVSIDNYFRERSYLDGRTLSNFGAAPAALAWTGAPNGQLDHPAAVEDANDNGLLDPKEDDLIASGAGTPDNGNGALEGDRLSIQIPAATAMKSIAWAGNLSVYDPDSNGLVNTLGGEFTMAQVTLHVMTHEMGHAAGIATHCADPTCLMFSQSENWSRQDHLCPRCQGLLLIHNH